MNQSDVIIVIGRQYAGGGREIGRIVAERLGIPYYDKQLLAEAAESFGIRKELFAKSDERSPSIFRSLLSLNYGSASSFYTGDGLSKEKMYDMTSKVIEDIIAKGSCVIVGRTADYIAREHPGLLSVFLHADKEKRAKTVIARGEATNMQEAKQYAKKRDSLRQGYYNYFTGRKWGEASNYHLCLDTSKLSASQAADIILDFLNKRQTNVVNTSEIEKQSESIQ